MLNFSANVGRLLPVMACCAAAFSTGNGSTLAAPAPSRSDTLIAQHIRNIENGIIPSVLPEGAPIPRATIAERMKALHIGGGVSIAFIHGGGVQWTRAYGATGPDGPRITPETLFQAGSISKVFAAVAALQLVQEGKLDLDTDVNTYLKNWKLPQSQLANGAKVTLRELLTHTAGFNVHGFDGYAAGKPLPTPVQTLNGQMPANNPAIALETRPNTAWNYSGGGFEIVQQLLEDVTGIPFQQLAKSAILARTGMTRSTFEQPLPQGLLAGAAKPYANNAVFLTDGPHVYPELAAAGLWTTPADLARFAIAIQNSLSGKSPRLLSAATARQMMTAGLGHWGIGVEIGGTEKPYFTHGGGTFGYACDLIAYENGDGVVIMTNAYNGPELFRELERTIAHEYGWPDFQPESRTAEPVAPSLLERYVGHYRTQSGDVRVVTRRGNQLFEREVGYPVYRLYSQGGQDFFLTDWSQTNATVTFAGGGGGPAASMVLHRDGKDDAAARIDDRDPAAIHADTVLQNIDQQRQSPGSEAVLRTLMDGLWQGRPDFDLASPSFVSVLQRLATQYKSASLDFGPLRSMTFEGVTGDGEDIYRLEFSKGLMHWRIGRDSDGKITSAGKVAGST